MKFRTKVEKRQFCDDECPCKKCHTGKNPNAKLCDFCVFEKWKKEPKPTKKKVIYDKEFFAFWTREQLITECIRLNKVLLDCLKISKK